MKPLRALLYASRSAELWLIPIGSLLIVVGLHSAGPRILLVVALPILFFGVVANRLPTAAAASVAIFVGLLALVGGIAARNDVVTVAAVPLVVAGLLGGWGVNRGLRRRHAWLNRGVTAVGTVLALFFVFYPTAIAIDYLAKAKDKIDPGALGIPHQDVSFRASDGVRLSGWYVPGTNGAAIVIVHGGGGDREGTVRQARMLAKAGYGVLLYDARGRGESLGHENAFGWLWHRDVHGAVTFLQTRGGVQRIGLLGISTGAEAVVTEAATDRRVLAVVSDGLQGRTASDASHLPFGDRISLEPGFTVLGAEIGLVRGESPPPPLMQLVHDVAATRPLLLIGTVSFEREFDRAYIRGTSAHLWELPKTEHTHGLIDHPTEYRRRVLGVFNRALAASGT